MTRQVVGRAPTRIDLGGGWTDVPPYCDREGGFVCNVAITRYSIARVMQATAERAGANGDEPLVRSALARRGVHDVSVGIENDFPVGAGLGGSSAASAALLAALSEWRGQPWTRDAIAEEGRRIEVEDLGVPGGRQDHYAATYGGALALTFSTAVVTRRILLDDHTRDELAARCVLVYTGQSRVSGDTITAVLDAYEQRSAHVVGALRRMRELAEQMADCLGRGDLDAMGGLVAEHWRHQRALHASIPTPRIDAIIAAADAQGALGAKAMGASGGGCVLIVARQGEGERMRSAMRAFGDVLDFRVAEDGLTVKGTL